MTCPVVHQNENHLQEEEDERFKHLSSQRIESSIPKSSSNPSLVWKYPSERMFMSALTKKGHKVNEKDISLIVPIHNIVNEKCWLEICRWERRFHPKSEPVLVEFKGKPGNLSPKAFLRWMFLGTQKPFDRHDWIVEVDGQRKRYVIDFYQGKEVETSKEGAQSSVPVSVFLDVRPALGIATLWERLKQMK